MSEPGTDWWSGDDELLGVLGEALREDAEVPPRVVESGRALFSMWSLDADLASLAYDSSADAGLVGATRGLRPAMRELSFTGGEVTLHLQLSETVLQGQVVPPQPAEVEVHQPGAAPLVVAADEQGWFALAPLPGSRFRLLARTADGSRTVTDWITP